jgi:hypothetical protein
MKPVHTVALGLFLALIGFIIFIGQKADNDETLYIGMIGLLVVVGLIALLTLIAKDQAEPTQKLYFTAIGTLIGLVGGLAGGAAIGTSAGQSAADDVANTVQSGQEQIKSDLQDVKEEVKKPGATP